MHRIDGGTDPLPLAGVRVIEFTHLIMGPVTGLILADLGADVIRVEPAPHGDPTRRLGGFLSGFSDYFNRNKRSVAIDLKRPESAQIVSGLLRDADVIVENFSPGAIERLGYGYDTVCTQHPRIVYCSLKGFLPGPYENRTALDEVVQFMGGLAYMTGPSGRPLRAGTSVVDLMGGTMAAVSILAALRERDRTGRGQRVQAGLFESVAFMMGQHMAAVALTGSDLPPMPEREGGWSIYQLFATADGDKVFIAITSDALWQRFCREFALGDLAADPRLATNAQRLEARGWMLPRIEAAIAGLGSADVVQRCTRGAIPFANVATVQTLFSDAHLHESGVLMDTALRDGTHAPLPGLPVRLSSHRLGVRRQPPRAGEHSREILAAAGFSATDIDAWIARGVVATSKGDVPEPARGS
jgi:crotonobetainyl-CoA:carnitine CoA-transferase CaiB-like acyl-CoA transferase